MMSDAMQAIGKALPLTYINDGLRLIMTENHNLIQVLPQIGILLGFSTIFAFVVLKTFKWDNEKA